MKSFQQLVNLNNQIPEIATKYSLFGNTPTAIAEVKKLSENMELINTTLEGILNDLSNFGDKAKEFEKEIERERELLNGKVMEVAKMVKELREKGVQITVQPY